MLAPFHTHVTIPNLLVPRIAVFLLSFHLMSAYIFSLTTTFVLAMIFSHQFKKIAKELECCLDNPQRRVSELDIEKFRQKHQEISMNVSRVDDCLMFSNASAFCCQLSCVIILLYVHIFYHSCITDPVSITIHAVWMFLVSFGLALTAAGGIVVHHYVSLFTLSFIY